MPSSNAGEEDECGGNIWWPINWDRCLASVRYLSLSLSLILKHGQKNVHGIVILYVRTYVLAYIKCLLIGCFLRFFGSFPFISGLFSPRCAHV
jgi:hypothetical protein